MVGIGNASIAAPAVAACSVLAEGPGRAEVGDSRPAKLPDAARGSVEGDRVGERVVVDQRLAEDRQDLDHQGEGTSVSGSVSNGTVASAIPCASILGIVVSPSIGSTPPLNE